MGRRRSQVIPDQGRKLLYLIETHGDRRPRSRKADGLAAGPDEGGSPRDDLSPIVTSPATLAQALGLSDGSSVSRWCAEEAAPIPARHLARICRIFRVEEDDFRTATYEAFVEVCAGRKLSTAVLRQPAPSAAWRRLVASATDRLAILSVDPSTDGGSSSRLIGRGYAAADRDHPDRSLPEVWQDTPFWIKLASPRRGARWLWADWHLLLFNHDLACDGFRMLLPRETNAAVDWTTIYPRAAHLDLPHSPVLRHPPTDHGRFGVVAVLSDEPAPRAYIDALARELAHGARIEATLDELAIWIEERVSLKRAALAGAHYRVVARRA